MQHNGVRLDKWFVFFLISIFYGCWFSQQPHGADDGSTRVELLLKGTYGTRTLAEPAVAWIKDQSALNTLYQELNARHGGKSNAAPQIDFKKFGILFLEMGQKPSGGFAINFDASKTQVNKDNLVLHINWKIPAEGMTVTQAITSPFFMLKIKHTDITSILVLDQNNRALFETHTD